MKNKTWIEQIETALKTLFEQTHVQYYKHWESGDPEAFIDLDHEINELVSSARNFGEYMIFAKSAGSWVTLRALHEGKISPQKLIFTGFAYNYAKNNNFPIDEWMKNLSIPSLFMQKEMDPAVPFDELRIAVEKNNVQHTELIEVPGDNHHYENIDLIKSEVEKFI